MNARELICPVSTERVNEIVTRCNAFLTILLLTVSVFFRMPEILILLVADFYLRAFTSVRNSPLTFISKQLVSWLNLGTKPTDKAPKIFAARLGFLMSLAILVLSVTGQTTSALAVAGILSIFAMLELAAGFCAGCYIYTYLILPATKD